MEQSVALVIMSILMKKIINEFNVALVHQIHLISIVDQKILSFGLLNLLILRLSSVIDVDELDEFNSTAPHSTIWQTRVS